MTVITELDELTGSSASFAEDLTVLRAQADTPASAAAMEAALVRAWQAHAGQLRLSGDPYIVHPVAVARLVADYGLDVDAVVAALLHDVVEDTDATEEDIDAEFGPNVARLVAGLTKLDGLRFESADAAAAAEVRKMIVHLAADVRAVIVKLCDRLHNMRTIQFLPVEAQQRIAAETLAVYAPLAHRLSMNSLRCELEDLAFAVLWPERAAEIAALVAARAPERDAALQEALAAARLTLEAAGLTVVVTGRAKHLFGIYEKMSRDGRSFDDVHDLIGLRVLVETVPDCYAALGALSAVWSPVPERFKDYIAAPKFNLYQSLHTLLVGDHGRPLEVQIRTYEMDEHAERGVAAHFSYKDAHRGRRLPADELDWVRRLLDAAEGDGDVLEALHEELASSEVFAFSPNGRVVRLPTGSTPVDFAYGIHTQIGDGCVGAKVNGRLVALNTPLHSGDRVEILTKRNSQPNPAWLSFVKSAKAKNKIRQTVRRAQRIELAEVGEQLLHEWLRDASVPLARIDELPAKLSYGDLADLAVAVAERRVTERQVTDVFRAPGEALPTARRKPSRRLQRAQATPVLLVDGQPGIAARLAGCCAPAPGDDVVGWSAGATISVHRTTCSNVADLEHRALQGDGRMVPVSFDAGRAVVGVELEALDRPALLADTTRAIADAGANIISSRTNTDSEGVVTQRFDIELDSTEQLDQVLVNLRRIPQVLSSRRTARHQS